MAVFPQIERFFWFHDRVKTGRHPNARHLAERFEISRKTAQRDIERMRDRLFAPLEYDAVRKGYYYTADHFDLPFLPASQQEILCLLLARMTDLQVLTENYEPRPASQWRPLLESSFGLFQGTRTVPVTLRFCPFRARWIRHQHWHPDQCLTEQPDGCLELTVPVSDFREIKMQIMQFGADVEVIAPEELRREIEAEIAKMYHLYRQRPPAE